jgi:hypothetical protein
MMYSRRDEETKSCRDDDSRWADFRFGRRGLSYLSGSHRHLRQHPYTSLPSYHLLDIHHDSADKHGNTRFLMQLGVSAGFAIR